MDKDAIIIVGDAYQSVFADLQPLISDMKSIVVPNLSHAISSINPSTPCKLIVCLQSWSDQFTELEILGLIDRYQGVPVICIYGPWCEGDDRNRMVWPLVCRVPWFDGVRVMRNVLYEITQNIPPLPLTASREEITASYFESPPLEVSSKEIKDTNITCRVHSLDYPWRAMIQDMLAEQNVMVKMPVDDVPAIADKGETYLSIIDGDTASLVPKTFADQKLCTPGNTLVLMGYLYGRNYDAHVKAGYNVMSKLAPQESMLHQLFSLDACA